MTPLAALPSMPRPARPGGAGAAGQAASPQSAGPSPRLRKQAITVQTALLDGGVAALGWVLFYALRRWMGQVEPKEYFSLGLSTLTIAGFWVIVHALAGLYTDVLRRSRIKDAASLAAASMAGALVLLVLLFAEDEGTQRLSVYARTFSAYLALHLALSLITKMAWLSYLKAGLLSGRYYFNTILIGSEASAQEVYSDILTNNPHLGIRFVGFVHVEQDEDHLMANRLVHLGHYSALEQILAEHQVEQAIIATEPSEHKLTEQVLTRLEVVSGTPVRSFILPDTYQILLGAVKVNHILGTPLIEVRQQLLPVWQQVAKRGLDIVASALVLLVAWPLYLALALAVRAGSPGPIIFSQERIGRHGRPFCIYKFRSMYVNAERYGPALSSARDSRITLFGRFMRRTRLDELPQFVNVLIGDMSLVGPRPERQYFIEQITRLAPHYRYINRVRPGITSLGMVKFGYAENVEQMVRRLRYDIMYIENMSLAMDLRILAFTILIVLQRKGK